MSIRGHQETFEVSQDLILLLPQGGIIKRNLLQISPPVIEQFGQFVLSVKNRRKLDAEKLSKLELQVLTNSLIYNLFGWEKKLHLLKLRVNWKKKQNGKSVQIGVAASINHLPLLCNSTLPSIAKI